MLYDHLNNISRYKGLYKGLDVFIDWLKNNKLEDLPLGRTELLGDKVFINVMNAEPRPLEGAEYEVHKKYMDLQLDIEGTENIQVPAEKIIWTQPLDPDKDIGFGIGRVGCSGRLGNGMFALFVAEEPHMPTLRADAPQVKKAVVKILRDELF